MGDSPYPSIRGVDAAQVGYSHWGASMLMEEPIFGGSLLSVGITREARLASLRQERDNLSRI